MPGRPDTVRGFSANVLLTEFAFFEQPEVTWRAILPSITNPLRGGPKKVRLITTPNGIGNKAHDLWVKNFQPERKTKEAGRRKRLARQRPRTHSFFLHPSSFKRRSGPATSLTSTRAIAEGLPVQLDQLMAALDDPEGWAQEFECQFLDVQSVLLPYELIASCESIEATAAVPPEYLADRAAASPSSWASTSVGATT